MPERSRPGTGDEERPPSRPPLLAFSLLAFPSLLEVAFAAAASFLALSAAFSAAAFAAGAPVLALPRRRSASSSA